MKSIPHLLLMTTVLSLTACNSIAMKQWLEPSKAAAELGQPEIKGINDTQEQAAKDAMEAGDFSRAGSTYEMLVASGKGNKEQQLRYKVGFAEALRRSGQLERALAQYEVLIAENQTNLDVAEGRALTLMALGKSVDASRAFADIVEKDGKRWRTLNALGILFVSKQMISEAMSYYTEALKFSPDNPAVLNNVGLSQAIDKNFHRALSALDQGIRFAKSPTQRKQIELNMAMVYGVSGDFENAREIASRYYEGPALENNMGLYAYLAKNDGLAKTYLNMALGQSPMHYERAWNNLDLIDGAGNSPAEEVAPNPSLPKFKSN